MNEMTQFTGDPGQIAQRQAEMTRRLIVAMREFKASADIWSRRLLIATWVQIFATAVIMGLTVVLAVKTP